MISYVSDRLSSLNEVCKPLKECYGKGAHPRFTCYVDLCIHLHLLIEYGV